MAPGTFAGLVIPALAANSAAAANCKPTFPPGLVVDACVAVWNKSFKGPALPYYVPPLNTAPGMPIIDTWQNISGWAQTGNEDPNAYYAFQSEIAILAALPGWTLPFSSPATAGSVQQTWGYLPRTGVTQFPTSQARLVNVNVGPAVPNLAGALGGLVVPTLTVGALGAAGLVGYSLWTGRSAIGILKGLLVR